jgi:hypothetical protein
MSTDINGVISHNLTFPPPANLPFAMTNGVQNVSPYVRNEWRWKEDFGNEADFRVICTQHGPSIWIGRRAAIISTGIGWDQVAEDSELREQIMSALFAIGQFFDSSQLVVLPDDVEPWCSITDSVIDSGSTLDHLVETLAAIRPPSLDFISALKGEPDYAVDGYLIIKLPITV